MILDIKVLILDIEVMILDWRQESAAVWKQRVGGGKNWLFGSGSGGGEGFFGDFPLNNMCM